MVSQKAEELGVIIRLHLVRFFIETSGNLCQNCATFPRGCIKCAEVRGNELGRQVEESIVRQLGGVRLTVPTLKVLETREKHRRIRKDFNGANQTELALEFGYSRTQVYYILAKKED